MATASLIILCLCSSARPDVVEFEVKSEWEVAVNGDFTTIDFTQLPPPPPVTYLLNQLAGYNLSFVDGFDTVHYSEGYLNDGVGVSGQGYISIRFAAPINWIAADFPGALQFEFYYLGELIETSKLFGIGGTGFFGGVISTQPFDQVLLFRPDPPFDPTAFIDDLHFGPSTIAADVTHDAIVGPVDLGELLSQWGPCPPDKSCGADFDKNGNVGPADLGQLLAGWSKDCNSNDTFDHLEVISVGDCNENGLPDDCDIAAANSEDCNANGVPDECELELLQPSYVIEDGENETQVALATPGPFVWLNHFIVQEGGETIDRILAAWGVGPADVAVWTDPNDDGIPIDAQLVTILEDVPLSFPIGGPFRTIEIPPTYVGEAGESFYVGLMLEQGEQEYPAWVDEDSTEPMQSWFWIDLTLSGAEPVENHGVTGHWLIRAAAPYNNDVDSNGIPDECQRAP